MANRSRETRRAGAKISKTSLWCSEDDIRGQRSWERVLLSLWPTLMCHAHTHSSVVKIRPMKFLVPKMNIVMTTAITASMATPVKAALFAALGFPAPSSLPTLTAAAVPKPNGI